jgi:hypothetical protein
MKINGDEQDMQDEETSCSSCISLLRNPFLRELHQNFHPILVKMKIELFRSGIPVPWKNSSQRS